MTGFFMIGKTELNWVKIQFAVKSVFKSVMKARGMFAICTILPRNTPLLSQYFYCLIICLVMGLFFETIFSKVSQKILKKDLCILKTFSSVFALDLGILLGLCSIIS